MTGNAGTPKPVCPRCWEFIVAITDALELTELQQDLIRFIHRRH